MSINILQSLSILLDGKITCTFIDSDMPAREERWTTYGVTKEIKMYVKVYAVKNSITIGESLNRIIEEYIQMKEKENNTDKNQ